MRRRCRGDGKGEGSCLIAYTSRDVPTLDTELELRGCFWCHELYEYTPSTTEMLSKLAKHILHFKIRLVIPGSFLCTGDGDPSAVLCNQRWGLVGQVAMSFGYCRGESS